MFKKRKDLVSTSYVGGKKGTLVLLCHFYKSVFQEKIVISIKQVHWFLLSSSYLGSQILTYYAYIFLI